MSSPQTSVPRLPLVSGSSTAPVNPLITEVQAITENLEELTRLCKKNPNFKGPVFHPIYKVDPMYLHSMVVPQEKFARTYEPVFGRVDILMDPAVTDSVSDQDEKFFNERDPQDEVNNEFTFLLDCLVSSNRIKDLNLFICDTFVIKKGAVVYFVFNSSSGVGPLRVIFRANQLIFPVLTTYFLKRRAMVYNRELKKERDFTNISHLFEDLHDSFEELEAEEERKRQSMEIHYFAYYKYQGKNLTLNQTEFVENLMSKRHDLSLWKKISNVTAMLGEKDGSYNLFRLRYVAKQYMSHPLYEKAKDYVLKLMDDYKPDYAHKDYQQQEALARHNITDYCLYMAFKIVWFLEIFYEKHVSKMLFVFIKFDPHRYYILDAWNIHHRKSDPRNINRYFVEKINMRDEEFKKQHLSKVTNEAYLEDDHKMVVINSFQKKLHEIYEEAKRDIDLDLYKEEPKDTRSDEAFALFHPQLDEINIKLTDITENHTVDMKSIKQYFHALYGGKPLPPLPYQVEEKQKLQESRKLKSSKSLFRIHGKAATQCLVRCSKGEAYSDPFAPEIFKRKKQLQTICAGKDAKASAVVNRLSAELISSIYRDK